MRGSVEAVTTYTVFFIQFVWDGIHICIVRHCLMECCIEYTYLRYIGQNSRNSIDTFQVSRVMEWSKVVASGKCIQYFFIQFHWFAETFPTVYHAVTYCIDFFQRLDCAIFRANQCVQDKFDTCSMFRDIFFQNLLFAIRQSQLQERTY